MHTKVATVAVNLQFNSHNTLKIKEWQMALAHAIPILKDKVAVTD